MKLHEIPSAGWEREMTQRGSAAGLSEFTLQSVLWYMIQAVFSEQRLKSLELSIIQILHRLH